MPVSVDTPLVLGVDLGGTNLRVALAGPDGLPIAEGSVPTAASSARDLVTRLSAAARDVAATAGVAWARVGAAGIGVPGVADGSTLLHAPNLPSFDGLALDAALRAELGVPVAVDNDVNVAALAEHRHGAAAGADDFVLVAVGTGIGMGIVAGGALQRGARGAAGEIGLLPLGTDPFDPANQVHGALEEAVGGVGIVRRYVERGGDPETDAQDVYARAEAGDAAALAVVDEQARSLALAVVAVHALLDPSVVVFGGGIGTRPDVLSRVEAILPRLTRHAPPLVPSRLGTRAGLIGAAQLAADLARETADV